MFCYYLFPLVLLPAIALGAGSINIASALGKAVENKAVNITTSKTAPTQQANAKATPTQQANATTKASSSNSPAAKNETSKSSSNNTTRDNNDASAKNRNATGINATHQDNNGTKFKPMCFWHKWHHRNVAIRSASERYNGSCDGQLPDNSQYCISWNDTTLRWYYDKDRKECLPYFGCKVVRENNKKKVNSFDNLHACAQKCGAQLKDGWKFELFGDCGLHHNATGNGNQNKVDVGKGNGNNTKGHDESGDDEDDDDDWKAGDH